MRALIRWTVAAAGSLAVFAASWAACQYLAGMDSGTSLAIAGALLAVALAVLGWWAAREPTVVRESPSDSSPNSASIVVSERSQVTSGNTGIIIGGDVRGATINVSSAQRSEKPLPLASPAVARASPEEPALVGDIPQRPLAFQPRDALLAPLRERVGSPGICVIHAVTGMRGTGKTQAAAAYARECVAEGWRLVAWVNAHGTAAAVDGLAKAAAAMKLPLGADQPASARALRAWLEADGHQCLIVFDNAPDPDTLRPYLPSTGLAHVIITSTRKSITSLGASIPVDVFTEPESLAYLAQRTGMMDSDGARAVAAELGHLPLALAQAGAVIAAQRLTYRTYLGRLRAFPLAEYLTRTNYDPYPHAVAAAILLSLQHACDSDSTGLAATLTDLIALLSPAGVSRRFLHAAFLAHAHPLTGQQEPDQDIPAQIAGPAAVDAALAHLADASLLTFSLDGSTLTAHRLTMRVIREQRAHDGTLPAGGAEAIAVLQTMTEMVIPVWQHPQTAKDLTQHIITLTGHLAPGADDHTAGRAEDLLRLRGWAVACLNDLGDYPAQAISIGQELVADSERILGANHPSTVAARSNLANAYREAGRAAEAIVLRQQTLADREQYLSSKHPWTRAARRSLANAYRQEGRAAEATILFEQILSDRERLLGADDPATAAARKYLAYARNAAEQAAEAVTRHEEILADREHVLGSYHPDTLTARSNLANAYRDAGRTAEAIALHVSNRGTRGDHVVAPDGHDGMILGVV